MRILNPQSIVFKTAVIYVFLTILNVSIFVLMVFENQLDLIAENAILTSQHKASSLKYRIDNIIGTRADLTTVNINKIIKEASALDIHTITLFSEGGKTFVNVVGSELIDRESADVNELKMINMAITKQGFEDKLFYHHVDRKEKIISLSDLFQSVSVIPQQPIPAECSLAPGLFHGRYAPSRYPPQHIRNRHQPFRPDH